jgi:hypothetical protein
MLPSSLRLDGVKEGAKMLKCCGEHPLRALAGNSQKTAIFGARADEHLGGL